MLVDDVILFDCGPDTARSAERAGRDLTSLEHVVISHGHPDHLDPALFLWRSWVSGPTPIVVHGPSAALELVRPWLDPAARAPEVPQLQPIAANESRQLVTRKGTYELRALAAQHVRTHDEEPGDIHARDALVYGLTDPDGQTLLYATDTAALPGPTVAALQGAKLDVVLLDETFGNVTDHDTGHHDLVSFAGQLDQLRAVGAVADSTDVIAVHLSHHNPIDVDAELHRIGARRVADRTIVASDGAAHGFIEFFIGGARSGKSKLAEQAAALATSVTYVATGVGFEDDADWQERVRLHQQRRPAHWTTLETLDLVDVLASSTKGDTVLIDCISLWVTGILDANDAWVDEAHLESAVAALRQRSDELIDALLQCPARVIIVTNEVGQGVVPATAAGRVFRDELGRLNAQVASTADRAHFVIAGRTIPLAAHRLISQEGGVR